MRCAARSVARRNVVVAAGIERTGVHGDATSRFGGQTADRTHVVDRTGRIDLEEMVTREFRGIAGRSVRSGKEVVIGSVEAERVVEPPWIGHSVRDEG